MIRKRVLYIEDNNDHRLLLKKILEADGYEVIEASDGLEGVEKATNERPDLILMDIDIPCMDGYEATARIKNIKGLEEIPIIALTAHVRQRDRDRPLSIGCDGYIPKPINIERLSIQIEEYLAGKKDRPDESNEKQYLREFSYKVVERLEDKVKALEEELEKNKELQERLRITNVILEEKVKIRTELLNRKVEELSILLETSHALSSTLKIEEILRIIAEEMTRSVEVTCCRIGVLDETKQGLTIIAAHSIREIGNIGIGRRYNLSDLKIYKDLLIDLQDRPKSPQQDVRDLNSYKEVLILRDQDRSEIKNGDEREILFIQDTRTIAIIPIISNKSLVGLAILNEMRSWNRSPFCEDKIRVCSAIASEAGVAIENAILFKELREANFDSIKALAEALETKDLYTKGHSDRMIAYAIKIADRLSLSNEEIEQLRYAVILHDIGKIGVREEILNKPTKLTEEEFIEVKNHPVKGADIIRKIKFLHSIVPLVYHHQERWDGKGYPDGLSEHDIPLSSRIISVLDAFDAMTSDRPYRKALSTEYAIEELVRCAGTQFDPKVVEAFIKVIKTIRS